MNKPQSMLFGKLLAGLVLVSLVGTGGLMLWKYVINSSTRNPKTDPTADWKTYKNNDGQFLFKYPQDLIPFEFSNKVVTFLPETSHKPCKEAHDLKDRGEKVDITVFEPCNQAKFNFTGYSSVLNGYEDYLTRYGNVASLSSLADKSNRTWKIGLLIGEVPNFDAFTEIDNKPIHLSFQYGFGSTSDTEVVEFFNQVLSTFKFMDQNTSYECPPTEYVDCMPGPGVKRVECEADYLQWAKSNCPGFKGGAY